jgi:transcriptional regulator with XRE-family HTH domain
MNIKKVIKDHGFSTQQIAQELNISQQAVSQAINGNPSLSRLQEIARVVGIPVSELVADDPTPDIQQGRGEVKIGDKIYEVTIKEL